MSMEMRYWKHLFLQKVQKNTFIHLGRLEGKAILCSVHGVAPDSKFMEISGSHLLYLFFLNLYICFFIFMLGILITMLLHAAYWHTWMKGEVCIRVTVCNSAVLKLLCYLGKGNQPWLASLLVLSHFTVLVIVLSSVPWRLQSLCLKIHSYK